LNEYALDRDRERTMVPAKGRVLFLGSKPVISREGRGRSLFWRWRLGDQRLRITPPKGGATGRAGDHEALARRTAALLEKIAGEGGVSTRTGPAAFYAELETLFGKAAGGVWKTLREGGLVCY
jgi:hypothetical protein